MKWDTFQNVPQKFKYVMYYVTNWSIIIREIILVLEKAILTSMVYGAIMTAVNVLMVKIPE